MPWLYYASCVLEQFPGWTLEYTQRTIERDQERGWPLRQMLMQRAFANKFHEVRHAQASEGATIPMDKLARRVVRIQMKYQQSKLKAFKQQRDAAGSPTPP